MTQFVALTEHHYTVNELANKWRLSPTAIRRLFRDEPGVVRFGRPKKGHQRDYFTWRIPASVAERVYCRCIRPALVLQRDGDRK
jgi:hypothetical protein